MSKKFVIKNFEDYGEHKNHLQDTRSLIVSGEENMDVSDGYHTMDELYEHRFVLYIALAEMISKFDSYSDWVPKVWRSKYHSDGKIAYNGRWFVLGINKEKGKQITYHIPISKWDETEWAETLDVSPEYDGHTSEDVIRRLKEI